MSTLYTQRRTTPFDLHMHLKRFFFDRAAVVRSMDRKTHQALRLAGGYIRKVAYNSIRKRKGTSEPGKPPYSHEGSLKRFLRFWYSPSQKTAMIGPAKTNQKNAWGQGNKTIPQVLEFGGVVRSYEHFVPDGLGGGKWVRTDLRYRINDSVYRSAVNRKRRVKNAIYKPRPFMRPAMEKAIAKDRLSKQFGVTLQGG